MPIAVPNYRSHKRSSNTGPRLPTIIPFLDLVISIAPHVEYFSDLIHKEIPPVAIELLHKGERIVELIQLCAYANSKLNIIR